MASIGLAVVVVVVVLLLRGPRDAAAQTRSCTSKNEIQRPREEQVIYNTLKGSNIWEKRISLYVVPQSGFEGVRVNVTTNAGIFPAWFPIMDHCALNDSRWWQMTLVVEKLTQSSLKSTLKVHNCSLSCEFSADATLQSSSDLKLKGWEVLGRGPSKWRTDYPNYPCQVVVVSPKPVPVTRFSCTNPPPLGNVFPTHLNNGKTQTKPTVNIAKPTTLATPTILLKSPVTHPPHGPTQNTHRKPTPTPSAAPTSSATPTRLSESTASHDGLTKPALVAIIVVVVAVVVVVVLRMRRKTQQENKARSKLSESLQEVQVMRNSLYEPLDQYTQHSGTHQDTHNHNHHNHNHS